MASLHTTPLRFEFTATAGDDAAIAALALQHCAYVSTRSERQPERAEAIAATHQQAYQKHLDTLPPAQRQAFSRTYTAACAQYYQQRLARQHARFRQRLLIALGAIVLMGAGTAWWVWG
jgi:hypothetical protein